MINIVNVYSQFKMSQPDDGRHSFFPIGNPFKRIFPRSSYLSPNLRALLNVFEETLAVRLETLKPKVHSDVCSLAWMKCAVESLSETHTDIKSLLTDLQLPVSEWDVQWINTYLDDSVKLLDICVAFSSELSHLDHGLLFLRLAVNGLDLSDGSLSEQQLKRSCKSLQDWIHHINMKSPRLASSSSVIQGLATSLCQAKVKNSMKGKVLMRAMYGVKVHTVFTFSVFASLLSASDSLLMDWHVSENFLWSKAFKELADDVYGEIQNAVSCQSGIILKELEAVHMHAEWVLTMTGDLSIEACKLPATCKMGFKDQENLHKTNADNAEATSMLLKTTNIDHGKRDALQHCALNLGESTGRFSNGLDCLSKQVRDFFQIVLTGRDALLCNLRAPSMAQENEVSMD